MNQPDVLKQVAKNWHLKEDEVIRALNGTKVKLKDGNYIDIDDILSTAIKYSDDLDNILHATPGVNATREQVKENVSSNVNPSNLTPVGQQKETIPGF